MVSCRCRRECAGAAGLSTIVGNHMPESSAAERVGRGGTSRRQASLDYGGARFVLLVVGQVDAAGVEVVLEDFAVAAPFDDRLEHALGLGRVEMLLQQGPEWL